MRYGYMCQPNAPGQAHSQRAVWLALRVARIRNAACGEMLILQWRTDRVGQTRQRKLLNSPPKQQKPAKPKNSAASLSLRPIAVSAANFRYHLPHQPPAQQKPAKPKKQRSLPLLAHLATHCGERSGLAIPSPPPAPRTAKTGEAEKTAQQKTAQQKPTK